MSRSARRDVVTLACAISAGIHGALAPAHFSEGAAAGAGFVAATVLLAASAMALTRRQAPDVLALLAALVLGGLLVSYALAITTGLPGMHPEREPIDGLALVTKAVEGLGLAAALTLLRRARPAARRHPHAHTKGAPA